MNTVTYWNKDLNKVVEQAEQEMNMTVGLLDWNPEMANQLIDTPDGKVINLQIQGDYYRICLIPKMPVSLLAGVEK